MMQKNRQEIKPQKRTGTSLYSGDPSQANKLKDQDITHREAELRWRKFNYTIK